MRAVYLLMITTILLAPLAGCTSDGDDEKNTSDNTSQITAKVNVIEAMVENSSSEDKVTSAEFIGRLAAGSQDTALNTIQYWLTCERDGNSINTDSVYLSEERNVTAGENFEFIVEFEGCAGASGETLTFRIEPDGGGPTIADLEVRSTAKGASLL